MFCFAYNSLFSTRFLYLAYNAFVFVYTVCFCSAAAGVTVGDITLIEFADACGSFLMHSAINVANCFRFHTAI